MSRQLHQRFSSLKAKQAAEFYSWLHSDVGSPLSQRVELFLKRWLDDAYGLRHLLLGATPKSFTGAPNIKDCFSMSPCLGSQSADFLADSAALPFESDSFQLVSLAFELDFTERPLPVLAEATRILAPGGHIMIAGFNAFSLHGIRRLSQIDKLMHSQTLAHQLGRLNLFQLNRWLSGLGFVSERIETSHYGQRATSSAWSWLYGSVDACLLGPIYFIKARKEVHGMTPAGASRQVKFRLTSNSIGKAAPQAHCAHTKQPPQAS